MLARCSSVLAAVALIALAVACVPPPQGQARGPVATSFSVAAARGAAPAEVDAVRAPAPLEPVAIDPAAIGALRDSARLPAVVLAEGPLPSGLTAMSLGETTRAEARGLPPVGGVRQAQLAEGQRATMDVELRTDQCLTVVVHGGLGIREVDAFVVAQASPEGQVLAQETVGGPLAVIGGQAGCFRPSRAGPAEVVVVARKGAGSVLVAVFVGAPPVAP